MYMMTPHKYQLCNAGDDICCVSSERVCVYLCSQPVTGYWDQWEPVVAGPVFTCQMTCDVPGRPAQDTNPAVLINSDVKTLRALQSLLSVSGPALYIPYINLTSE